MLRFLARNDVDAVAWDACVAASSQRIIYGFSWYLDAVTAGRNTWRWVGLVMTDESGTYQAVMPVPLRRKFVARVAYDWVVHQPLFCQFLAVFSPDEALDPTPFLRAIQQRYRYGSVLNLRLNIRPLANFGVVDPRITHVLDLSADYVTIAQHYTHDRKLNVRRAAAANWTTTDSTDPEPLLTLFRDHHANGIDGGVGTWAYAILRNLIGALQERKLATIRYALRHGQIEAGALFVTEGNRIIYLFNAASEIGRRANARTLLIDEVIRANAGKPLLFDFESPPKESIVGFYRSFGAVSEPFWAVRWSRLNWVERGAVALLRVVR